MNRAGIPTTQYMPMDRFTASSHSIEMSRASVSLGNGAAEHESDDPESIATESAQQTAHEQIFASSSDEDLEDTLVGWVEPTDSDVDNRNLEPDGIPEAITENPPTTQGVSHSDSSTTEMTLVLAEPTRIVSEVAFDEQSQEGRSWQFIGGVTLAITSAGAAMWLERIVITLSVAPPVSFTNFSWFRHLRRKKSDSGLPNKPASASYGS
jgi:hypothetical protein